MPRERVAAVRRAGPALSLAGGPAAFVILLAVAPPSLPPAAQEVLALTGWMAVWWLAEPVPLAATSLLPIALLPALGAVDARAAAAPYANEIVFLFLAGFLLAAALETWRAHTRIAYALITRLGGGARRAIFGVMVATAAISMWISNTATAAMMYPIALAIGALFGTGADAHRARTALMLGVAYAASIGGMGTLIGTPPNLILAGAAQQLTGRTIGFGQFMAMGVPMIVLLLPLTWALLTMVLFRSAPSTGSDARQAVREEHEALGAMASGERRTVGVFIVAAIAWTFREPKVVGALRIPGLTDLLPGITDATVGIAAAVLLFALRGRDRDGQRRPLLTWTEARRIPWDVLLLFGGGLSLAAAMEATGLATWIGERLQGLAGFSTILVYAGLGLVVLALSEIASNTAVAAMVMPLVATLGTAIGEPPLALMIVAAFAASTGFALPVATPPNTIVYGSGQVRVGDMARAGIVLDGLAIIVIIAVVRLLYAPLFG